MPLGCFCIKASGAVRTAIPALRARIESLAADKKFAQWREHRLRSSAALKARVRDDARRLAVKFYSDGNSGAVAQAKTILNEEIDHVMSLYFVMLDRRAPSNVKYMYKLQLKLVEPAF
ncbi:hypothetical protein ARMGADRAFT_1079776 [Armillaria gallica]|uniref:Uncharacterized protein n=1 Tax=Armillaria gallica TaxID=47427 RepID=A0A2H3DPR4_ARMGA|nr:hypothetical protein ARMGADRAFT_1079776 [Armillaria gallica]